MASYLSPAGQGEGQFMQMKIYSNSSGKVILGEPQTLAGTKRKRNRPIVSCMSCHDAKRGCDRARPCSRCVERQIPDDCMYQDDDVDGVPLVLDGHESDYSQRQTPVRILETPNPRSESPLEELPTIKNKDFYIEDGGLVLVTRDHPGSPGNLFRVSKHLLAQHSARLHELVANPPTGETLEGCPLIRLDESTRDVESLFKMLWGGPWTKKARDTVTSEFVLGVHRLSRKWDIPGLTDWSLERLNAKIPVTYDAFRNDRTLSVFSSQQPWISPFTVISFAQTAQEPKFGAIAWYYLTIEEWANYSPEERKHVLRAADEDSGPEGFDWLRLVVNQQTLRKRSLEQWEEELGRSAPFSCGGFVPSGKLKSQPCASNDFKAAFLLSGLMQYSPLTLVDGLSETQFCPACLPRLRLVAHTASGRLFNALPSIFSM